LHVERLVTRDSIRALGLVLLAAVAVRGYLFFATPVITKDGAHYIGQAQRIGEGAWRQAFMFDLEPIFPFSIFLMQQVVPDWEAAGKLASLTWGVLAVVPLFLIARRIFGVRIAFWTGLFFSLHPYFAWNSADVLTESSYIFFFLLSLWFALVALERSSMGWHFLCAGAILLTRLSRTEGIWVVVSVILFYAVRGWRDLRVREWRGFAPLVRFSAAFVVVMLPVIVYGREIGSTSELVAYKGLGWTLYVLGRAQAAFQQSWSALDNVGTFSQVAVLVWRYYIYKFLVLFHPMLLLLTMYAVLKRDARRQYRNYFLLTASVWLIYLGGVFVAGFIRGVEATSRRYMMAPVAVALPWAALGADLAAARLDEWGWAQRCREFIKSIPGFSSIGLGWRSSILAVAMLVLAVTTVQPHRLDKVPIKDAAAWIVAQKTRDPVIIGNDNRIAFYANGKMVPVGETLEKKTAEQQAWTVRDIMAAASSRRANFIFLKGALYPEAQRAVQASDAVKEIKEWKSPYGDAYTLIQLREGR